MKHIPIIAALAALSAAAMSAQTPKEAPIPRIVQKDGRHALMVDGAPYLILGAQVNNSSTWPSQMPNVWQTIERLNANTVEIPIYWEQFEPNPGQYDTSAVDMVLTQAREHKVRVVLLWFGAYKNGSAHYVPMWVKREPHKYVTKVVGSHGKLVDSPSPHCTALLEADAKAFGAFMRHLKKADPQRTVIMVQVENEPGTWGSVRDFSPVAQKLFESPVPAPLLKELKKDGVAAGANWQQAFGPDADEFFHAWSVATFVGKVAAAGKREYDLPLYTNAALRDPLNPPPASKYESGGPTDNVIPIWKAAAPQLALLAPDIYLGDSPRYVKVLELYSRYDNPLFIPETGGGPNFAKHFFSALAKGAIGFSPFGVDRAPSLDVPVAPEAAQREDPLLHIALNYKLVGPMAREIARLNFEGKLKAVAGEKDVPTNSLEFGSWNGVVSYGPSRGNRIQGRQDGQELGRALIAQLGEDQFLVAGLYCKVDFKDAGGKQREFLRVEEGTYENGQFKSSRILNGDQTDWALNFGARPQVLRVTLGRY